MLGRFVSRQNIDLEATNPEVSDSNLGHSTGNSDRRVRWFSFPFRQNAAYFRVGHNSSSAFSYSSVHNPVIPHHAVGKAAELPWKLCEL